MSNDPENPRLYGTQKDYAWNAYQEGFGDGVLLPSRTRFEGWWQHYGVPGSWTSVRELMRAAWAAGVEDRHDQGQDGFNAWWQQILDSQPKAGT